MSLLYGSGQYFNVIEQALSVTVSDEDATFVKAYLTDGKPSLRFKFGTNGADRKVTVDLCRLINPGLETTTLASWTQVVTGTGATADEGTIVHSGSHALKCTAGTGTAARYQDITVRSGQRLYLDAWCRAASSGTARIRIYNLTTAKYLTSAAAWQTASTDAATETGTSYVQKTLAFTVESWATCQASTVTLRVTLACEGATGIAYFDDVCVYPAVNFCAVIGHNIAPIVVPEVHSSTDNFSSSDTTEATMTPLRPAFYSSFTSATKRYWQLKLSGTNVATPYIGELVLGYIETADVAQRYEWTLTSKQPNVRYENMGREAWVYRQTQDEVRDLRLEFRWVQDSAQVKAFRDEILRRSGFGEFPVIIVPYHLEPEVIHGRVPTENEIKRILLDVWDSDLTIMGNGLPTSGL